MLFIKIVAVLTLVILLSAAAWGLTHVGRIRRSLKQNDAMPRPVPATNIVLWLSILCLVLSSLLIGFIFN